MLLKFLSEQPQNVCWLESVHANDVRTVLLTGGALSAASRVLFKSFDLSDFRAEKSREYRKLANVMAPHIECLLLREPEHRRLNFERLSSLRVLKFNHTVGSSVMERIIAACGASLQELDVGTGWLRRKVIRSIGRHCKSLKVFCIGYAVYRATLEPIWRGVGNTLIELRGHILEKELVHITEHCTLLEKLCLVNLRELGFASDSLLIGLLRKLKALRVLFLDLYDFGEMPYFSVEDIRMLLDVCPPDIHVYSETMAEHNVDFLDFIRVIGVRFRKLRLTCEFKHVPSDILPAFANIEQLHLHPFAGDMPTEFRVMMESVFAEPMPNLCKLSIALDNSEILPIVARSVSYLREFECLFSTRFGEEERIPVVGAHFTELLQANKRLTRISLNYDHAEESLDNEIVDFIPCLRDCTELKVVTISYMKDHEMGENAKPNSEKSELIKDACVSLRNKPLTLAVNSVCYLP